MGLIRALVGAIAAGALFAAPATAASWSPLEAPGDGVSALVCPSTGHCLALGNPSSLSWNGTAWSTTPSPDGSKFAGLTCTSARACVAVGSDSLTTLIERYRGHRWVPQRSPNPEPTIPPGAFRDSRLASVACPAVRWCVAVGHAGYGFPHSRAEAAADSLNASRALIERWNGRRWTIQARPRLHGDLTSVSCSSTTDCFAVGVGTDLHWNGRAWLVKRPRRPDGVVLASVSCPAAAACLAVGSTGSPFASSFVAERWNGRHWSPITLPTPSGVTGGNLDGIDCLSTRFCVAVGQHRSGGFPGASSVGPLVARWNGKVWRADALPATGSGVEGLDVVSCLSTHWCMAVGDGFAEKYA